MIDLSGVPPRPWTASDELAGRPIVAPRMPAAEPSRPFPVLATLAPVLGSVAIWLITSSPFALVFAALGPVIAVATVGDQVFGGRRRYRRAVQRVRADLVRFEAEVAARHELERAELERRFPEIGRRTLPRRAMGEPSLRGDPDRVPTRIGRGTVLSSLRVDADPARATSEAASDRAVAGELAAAVRSAGRLVEAPVLVDARGGVAFAGPAAAVLPAARAYLVNLLWSLPPGGTVVHRTPSSRWSWMQALPHRIVDAPPADAPPPDSVPPDSVSLDSVSPDRVSPDRVSLDRVSPDTVLIESRDARFVVVVATSTAVLPPTVGTVVEVGSMGATLRMGAADAIPLRPDILSVEQATEVARLLAQTAPGDAGDARRPPDTVEFGDILPAPADRDAVRADYGGSDGLSTLLGRDADGPVEVDLVRDGPHAVIGGTTGSGKSELLVTWVLGLAARHPPEVVTFLLVDFKGGATMDALGRLPHTLGVVTDLDRGGATRAVSSLGAEVRRRERLLAAAGCRSIEHLPARDGRPGMPRLVIVVDEFAALASEAPDLTPVFTDLAARGRSLGIHLLLCTQRPAGVVREAVLANCTLRVSLRVATTADSTALLGSPLAAELPRLPRGRALLSIAGEPPTLLQVARASLADHEDVERRWPRVDLPVPWCPPLPSRIALADLRPVPEAGSAGIRFALADLPDLQRHQTEVWSPAGEGSLLVIGRAASGRSSTLRAIASAGAEAGWRVRVVPPDPAGAWDALVGAEGEVGGHPSGLVIVDDLDAVLARFGDDHRLAVTETLTRLVRDGPSVGTHLVASARRITSAMQPIASVIDGRLLLALPSRHEHLLCGGTADTFDPALAPGGAHRGARRLQVAWVPDDGVVAAVPSSPAAPDLIPGGVSAVVSSSPSRFASLAGGAAVSIVDLAELDGPGMLLPDAPKAHRLVVGAPDLWNARWTLLSSIRARSEVIVHACTVSEFRAVTGSRRLPPPLADAARDAWCVSRGGEVRRVRF